MAAKKQWRNFCQLSEIISPQYQAICFRRPQVSLNASVSSAGSKEQLSEMGFKLVTGFRIIFDHAGSVQVKEAPESK